jgi:serine/threonine protein kinase
VLSIVSLTTEDGTALLQQASAMSQIGSGAFGTVYRCSLRDVTVAVKVFSASGAGSHHQLLQLQSNDHGMSRDMVSELRALRKLHNVYLVKMFGVAEALGKHMLVMEYVPNGTLYQLLRDEQNHFVEANSVLLDDSSDSKSQSATSDALSLVRTIGAFSLSVSDRHCIACEVAAALVYLHANNCIHRDIKSLNILMDEAMHVKLCDFGMARFENLNTMMTTAAGAGTPQYMAPEVWTKRAVSTAADVYAYGVLLFEIFTGTVPWSKLSGPAVFNQIAQQCLISDEMKHLLAGSSNTSSLLHSHHVSESVLSIVFDCVQLDASKRPSMAQVASRLAACDVAAAAAAADFQ